MSYININTGRECELPKEVTLADGKTIHFPHLEDLPRDMGIRIKPEAKADDGKVLLSVKYEDDQESLTARAIRVQTTQAALDASYDAIEAMQKADENKRKEERDKELEEIRKEFPDEKQQARIIKLWERRF